MLNRRLCHWFSPKSIIQHRLLSKPMVTVCPSSTIVENQRMSEDFLSSTNDYYARKRIEQLHDRMEAIQISNFIKFINYHLSIHRPSENRVHDFVKDLADGHVFLDLIEIFSSSKVQREYGKTRFHSLSNVQYVLDYLKVYIQHVNISPNEIVSGNRKQILALLWTIMKRFNFPSFCLTPNKNFFGEQTLLTSGHDRSLLLRWINSILNQIRPNENIRIKDFTGKTWFEYDDYFLDIIHYLSPLSENYSTKKSIDYLEQLELESIDREQRWKLISNFSSYLFRTNNFHFYPKDQNEKNLLRFFSEIYQFLLECFQNKSIDDLHRNDPYRIQLIENLLKSIDIGESVMVQTSEKVDFSAIARKRDSCWLETKSVYEYRSIVVNLREIFFFCVI